MEPLLSVIVPVYNAQKYLLACYNSLKQQTYPNLEFIFVDDGSTDASFKLLCDLKKRDSRVKVISQTNQGQVLARKAGLAAACGDYIAFMDNDDTLPADAYQLLVENAKASQAEISMGSYYQLLDQKILKTFIQGLGFVSGQAKAADKHDFEIKSAYEVLSNLNNNQAQARYSGLLWDKIYRKEVIREAFLQVDTRLRIGDDMVCLFEALLNATTVAVSTVPVYYYAATPTAYSRTRHTLKKSYAKLMYQNLLACLKLHQLQNDVILLKQVRLWTIRNLLYFEYDKLSTLEGIFPFDGVKAGERILLYGAGILGQAIWRIYAKPNKYHLVGLVDKKADAYSGDVKPLAFIKDVSFDKCLVCLFTQQYYPQIKKDLLKLGVSEAKICFIDYQMLLKVDLVQLFKKID